MAKKVSIDLNENTKIIAFAGGIVLLAIIISINVIGFYNKKVNDLRAKIVEEKKILALREDISKITDVRDEYRKHVYKGLEQSELRNTISALARESGVDIVSIQPTKPGTLGVLSKVTFTVKLKASYNELGAFLAKLESYHLIIKIDSLSINNASNPSLYSSSAGIKKEDLIKKDTRAEVEVQISAYSLKAK